MTNRTTKLCLISFGAYPLLCGKKPKNIIGPDVHQVILAKELIKHNFIVSVICYGNDYPIIEHINNIEIIKIAESSHRLRLLNIASKVIYVWSALGKANAHIYFHAGGLVGVGSIFCKLTGKKYVYEIASDALVNRKIVTQKIREFSQSKLSLRALGNWLDIKLADCIIVQNKYQKKMLKMNFGKDGILIKMPFTLSEKHEKANPPIALWVGSIAEVKQPELFVKLAAKIPEARFQMIGGYSGNKKLYDRIENAAGRIPNFEFLGVVSFDEIDEYFGRASILINTSMFEGFPNAFIQAWMHYLPVVSLNADPDGLIQKNGLGFYSKKFDQLVKDTENLLSDERIRVGMGTAGRKYVEREHDIKKNIMNYLNIIKIISK